MTCATDAKVECYAQRLLNPFRGVVQVIRYAAAEAVSIDGLHWEIYVSNSALLDGLDGGDQGRRIQISDIRYGGWSTEQGLKRGPLYPSEDFRQMEAMGAVVHEHLRRVHDQVPFRCRDTFELWLLDQERAPLALLESAVHERDMACDAQPVWHAGYSAEAGFSRQSSAHPREAGNAARRLTRYINQRAGPRPAAQWFQRLADGSGQGGASIGGPGGDSRGGLAGRRLGPEAFPPKLLASAAAGDPHQTLLEDYLDWLAPSLLQLWDLADAERARLEVLARLRAGEVRRMHRLYPRVLDPAMINAARVEAMLCDSDAARSPEDDDLSTYYIELSPGGAE